MDYTFSDGTPPAAKHAAAAGRVAMLRMFSMVWVPASTPTSRDVYKRQAHDFGHSAPALAMAWVLDQGPHLIPIPGTRSAAHLADWANADAITMTPEMRRAIDQLLPVGWASGDRYGADQASTVERYC